MESRKSLLRLAAACLLASASVVMPWNTPAALAVSNCTGYANHTSRSGTRTILVPVTSGGSENCQRGPTSSTLNATTAIQAALVLCYGRDLGTSGPDHDGIDGVYGSKTIAAVKWVQKYLGVTVDGVYGPKTHNVMQFIFSADGEGGCATAKKV